MNLKQEQKIVLVISEVEEEDLIMNNERKEKIHTFLKKVDEIIGTHSEYDKKFFFRGLSDVDYQLIPSIGRSTTLLKNEKLIKIAAMNGRPDVFDKKCEEFERLALMQHYGIPTRLMDVTSNVLVALYFACKDVKSTKDGVVYIFKSAKYNVTDSDTVNNILCGNSEFDGAGNYLFLEAPMSLLRQRVQQGAYILFSDPTIPIDDTVSEYVDKVVISGNKKADLLEQLENLGITEASLFPENIDIFGKNIAKRFEQEY